MTSRGFVFLLLVTVAAIALAARIAATYTAPGLERTIAVAILTALALWPASKFAERRGWVRGELQLGRLRAPPAGPGAAAGPEPRAPAEPAARAVAGTDSQGSTR